MGNLDKVVYLCPSFYNSLSQCCPVNCNICAKLHIVFNNNTANLWNLVMLALICCIAKTIAAYDYAAVQYYPLSNYNIFPYSYIWINKRVIANNAVVANINTRIYYNPVADLCIIAYYSKWIYADIFANCYIISNNSLLVYASWFVFLFMKIF